MSSVKFESFLNSHSFLMIQSNNAKLGDSLPWIVCSIDRTILKTSEPQPGETYNYSVNCSFYEHRGRRFALAEAQDIVQFLAANRLDSLKGPAYIELGEQILLETYVYIPKQREFVQADPTYLHRSGVVLVEFDNPELVYQKCEPMTPVATKNPRYFHFRSEFALASDAHFLNCLQRGKSLIGCYEKTGSGIRPVVSDEIYRWVDELYTRARL